MLSSCDQVDIWCTNHILQSNGFDYGELVGTQTRPWVHSPQMSKYDSEGQKSVFRVKNIEGLAKVTFKLSVLPKNNEFCQISGG